MLCIERPDCGTAKIIGDRGLPPYLYRARSLRRRARKREICQQERTYIHTYLVEALADLTQVELGTPVSRFDRQGLKRLPRLGAVNALLQQEQGTRIGVCVFMSCMAVVVLP